MEKSSLLREGIYMNVAKVSTRGQITVPAEIRRMLNLRSGDKILFFQKQGGEVIMRNASAEPIRKAQAAFVGAADMMNVRGEEDVQSLVDELRCEARYAHTD